MSHRLSRMGIKWKNDLSIEFQLLLLRQLETCSFEEMSLETYLDLIQGLNEMDLKWFMTSQSFQQKFEKYLLKCLERDLPGQGALFLTRFLKNLYSIGYKWDSSSQIPDKFLQEITKFLETTMKDEISRGTALFSATICSFLGRMSMEWSGIPSTLQTLLLDSIQKYSAVFNDGEIAMIVEG
jgi:hypothetical protein